MRLGELSQFRRWARPVGQQIGETELGRDVDRARDVQPLDHPQQGCSGHLHVAIHMRASAAFVAAVGDIGAFVMLLPLRSTDTAKGAAAVFSTYDSPTLHER